MDRDSKFSAAFRQILSDAGTEPVRLPPRSPNLNAHIERFWRSLREECTDRMIFFGEAMLRRSVLEFVRHYHGERNHQGLDHRLIEPAKQVGNVLATSTVAIGWAACYGTIADKQRSSTGRSRRCPPAVLRAENDRRRLVRRLSPWQAFDERNATVSKCHYARRIQPFRVAGSAVHFFSPYGRRSAARRIDGLGEQSDSRGENPATTRMTRLQSGNSQKPPRSGLVHQRRDIREVQRRHWTEQEPVM
jgi:integrase-like protein